jgi:hypothetical protein
MINYFIRPGGAYVKIDTDTEIVSLVLNVDTQKTLSVIANNSDYYNSTVSASASWPTSDQTVYDTNKDIVTQYISNH